MNRVVIIGGGLAGLSTAFFLQQARPDLEVTVLEKEPQAGGKVRSSHRAGYTVDWAANGFLPSVPDTLELAQTLGLELQEAAVVAKNRLLYKNGALRKLPATPPAFLTSNLLLPSEKLRAAAEPLLGRAHHNNSGGEESVYDFVARHFGRGRRGRVRGTVCVGHHRRRREAAEPRRALSAVSGARAHPRQPGAGA